MAGGVHGGGWPVAAAMAGCLCMRNSPRRERTWNDHILDGTHRDRPGPTGSRPRFWARGELRAPHGPRGPGWSRRGDLPPPSDGFQAGCTEAGRGPFGGPGGSSSFHSARAVLQKVAHWDPGVGLGTVGRPFESGTDKKATRGVTCRGAVIRLEALGSPTVRGPRPKIGPKAAQGRRRQGEIRAASPRQRRWSIATPPET